MVVLHEGVCDACLRHGLRMKALEEEASVVLKHARRDEQDI